MPTKTTLNPSQNENRSQQYKLEKRAREVEELADKINSLNGNMSALKNIEKKTKDENKGLEGRLIELKVRSNMFLQILFSFKFYIKFFQFLIQFYNSVNQLYQGYSLMLPKLLLFIQIALAVFLFTSSCKFTCFTIR